MTARGKKPTPYEVMQEFLQGKGPKKKESAPPRHLESQLQRQCVAWFRLQYPKLELNLFAVGNGGRRGKTEAAIMKGEGVTAGVADLLLLAPDAAGTFHGLCIEMKTTEKDSRQRDTQKAWQAAVGRTGYKYVICRTFEEFQAAVTAYIPPNSRPCW